MQGTQFDLWSKKIPHSAGQLAEPVLRSWRATTTEPVCHPADSRTPQQDVHTADARTPRAHVPQQDVHTAEAGAPQSPCSPARGHHNEKPTYCNWRVVPTLCN